MRTGGGAEGAVADPRARGPGVSARAAQEQQSADDGGVRLEGLVHQHLADDRLRRSAGHQRAPRPERLRGPRAAALRPPR